jgi:hypothetical protein
LFFKKFKQDFACTLLLPNPYHWAKIENMSYSHPDFYDFEGKMTDTLGLVHVNLTQGMAKKFAKGAS